ncbi:DUF4349 domain-containing protein [Mucilaginibacter sp. BJC16-A38]|uniref:DUF4349 domain-containing protein n=1 Tax=Mucilaginibacter phenanthrenivorans TaxID=1234842 RepID=UPI0021575F55|nr:DUF4349 domain-containing protein [Mucilaginibacter phenanthrenivorans]MCR8558023.1 DUF4349 domain-containing protein [Mucilaginibacter phenanthrenivorans]
MKRLIWLPALCFLLAACGNGNPGKEKAKAMNVVLKNAPAAADMVVSYKKAAIPDPGVRDTSKKVTKEGEISFEAGNISEARTAIYNSLTQLGGYIAEESEKNNSDNNRKEYNISARVPAKSFERFLSGVSSIAERVDSKDISIKDVTTEYIDMSAQLSNKKKLEERYLDLLKKANKMSDVLEIEDKLTEIRSDIESAQGQLNYLVKQVNYSSLDITFYARELVQDNGKTFGYKLMSALSGGWEVLGVMFFGFLGLWPLWIVLIILFYMVKAWHKKNKANDGEAKNSLPQ